MTIDQEIDAAVKVLQKCGKLYYEHRQRVAALGGSYAASAAESAAPRSKKEHYRYNTAKLTKKLRAPKGFGNKVATYTPGNLGRSMKVLVFKQAKSKVYVGAKFVKRGGKGNFNSPNKTDGWYMHFVEKGTVRSKAKPFFGASWARSKDRVFGIMKREFERLGRQFEQQNAIR